MPIDPKIQRFNAVLETLDGLTLFQYDQETDPMALLLCFTTWLPSNTQSSTLIKEYIAAAGALDYIS